MVAALIHRQLVVINIPRPQRDARSLDCEPQIGLNSKAAVWSQLLAR
jgi:hypothetical protein